jgi:hypothetical protein
MNSLVNTSNYKFIARDPVAIINKTALDGSMRPIALFSVEIPRTGAVLMKHMMKSSFTIYNDDDTVRKVIHKNIHDPCGNPYGSVTHGLLEVPCFSVYDPNNVVADISHNLYEKKTRNGKGAFTSDPMEEIIGFFDADVKSGNIKSYTFTTSALLFKGIDTAGKDILEPIYSSMSDDGDGDDYGQDDGDDDGLLSRTVTHYESADFDAELQMVRKQAADLAEADYHTTREESTDLNLTEIPTR